MLKADFDSRPFFMADDSIGRLSLIDPCDSRWHNTSISYANTSSNEGNSHLYAGMLKQTISTGNHQKVVYHDGFYRPTFVKEWDTAMPSTARYSRSEYDGVGRAIYQSLPSDSTSTPYGTLTTYDGLNRTKTVDDNTTAGNVSYAYLSNHRVQVNDNKGNVTTTQYYSYGQPSLDLTTHINSPEGVSTLMAYNLYGNVTSISQGGLTEQRVYDSYQQLCKTVRPDVGNSAFAYDVKGQMSWQASGSSISTSSSSCDYAVSAADKITYTYNSIGSLLSVNFADSSPDQNYLYDPGNRLTRLIAGNVTTYYEYNSNNLVEKETLAVDGQNFVLDYAYNANGHLSSTLYPSGNNVAYSPNALGQAKQVGSFANNATYHPNGMVKTHNYGNGFSHTSTQNTSGLPSTFYDRLNSSYALHHGFTYDANNNITFLDDRVNNAYDLSLTFDGLDRLNNITDSYLGAGDVNYDTMGNITYYKLGNRTINYTYNSQKQLAYTSGSKSYNFNYDAKGNVTNNGTRTFVYNTANQMVQSGGYYYTYDGKGKRVKEVGSAGTSYSFYGSNGKLMYRQANNQDIDYYYLGSKLVANKKGSTVTYLHSDYLGSPAATTNTANAITDRSNRSPNPVYCQLM